MFGTPAAAAYEAVGFFKWSGGAGERYVWARREVEVALRFADRVARTAVVDLRPFEGVKDQTAAVLLNGSAVAHLTLGPARQRYLIPLPAAAQRLGDNRLRFEFGATASVSDVQKSSSDGGQLAAAFFGLVIGREDDETLLGLLQRGVPAPFSRVDEAGVPAFSQPSGSVVSYALSLPGRAELRFTPMARGALSEVRMRVTFESIQGQQRELWAATIDPRASGAPEVALPLPGVAGEAMRVSLYVDSAGPERSGVWRAPRVLGLTDAASAGALVRSAELRRHVAGKSVVFVILDAARARQLSCYGYSRPTTPEIDRIASEGVLFENAATPAVYTVGAMSSIWTSQQPDEHHSDTVFEAPLPGDRLTLPEVLTASGVKTAGFVANAMAGRGLGFARGFSEFHEVFGDPELRDPELGSRAELFQRVVPRWLAGQKQRFFLYVHFREPHFPYDPPAPFRTRFGPDSPLPPDVSRERDWYVDVNRGNRRPSGAEIEHLVRLYDGNLAYVDREVGRLRRSLEQAGLWNDVVLVLAADHGEQLYEHGYISHSAQVYEESTHVPLIVRLPSGAEAGRRVRATVDLLDVAPTIADVFGVLGQGGSEREFEGRSLLPVIAGAPGKRLVVSRSVWDRPLYAVRAGRHKLILDTRSGEQQLFDVAQDPREQSDRLAADPLRAATLREDLFDWLGRLRRRSGGGGEAAHLTIEQCENLRSLGYVSRCP